VWENSSLSAVQGSALHLSDAPDFVHQMEASRDQHNAGYNTPYSAASLSEARFLWNLFLETENVSSTSTSVGLSWVNFLKHLDGFNLDSLSDEVYIMFVSLPDYQRGPYDLSEGRPSGAQGGYSSQRPQGAQGVNTSHRSYTDAVLRRLDPNTSQGSSGAQGFSASHIQPGSGRGNTNQRSSGAFTSITGRMGGNTNQRPWGAQGSNANQGQSGSEGGTNTNPRQPGVALPVGCGARTRHVATSSLGSSSLPTGSLTISTLPARTTRSAASLIAAGYMEWDAQNTCGRRAGMTLNIYIFF